MKNTIKAGKYTIEKEIEGLRAISDDLGEQFFLCVKLIHSLKGRLIITGMGKSGHIAKKIAATIASTGTPAYFVHPAEASHGDMGMITEDDAILMLSNSGETAELSDMVEYAKRFSIPIISIVRRAESMLVDAANIAIILPAIAEASPVGAPTTSTTMMIAYGDAIAMALLEIQGFTQDNFLTFHPGGKLGKRLLKAIDLMHTNIPICNINDIMKDILLIITSKSFGCCAVIDGDKLQGVITDGDIRRHMDDNILKKTAKNIMTKNPVIGKENMLAAEALAIMNEKSITALFIVKDNNPIGILHLHDLLRAGII